MSDQPVYIDPYDEGRELAKMNPELLTAGLLAQSSEAIAPILAYAPHDWRRFRQGALSVLVKHRETV